MKFGRMVAAAAMLSLVCVAPACGGGQSAKSANVPAGDMPPGETWTGVYYHPVFGFLHLVEQGGSVVGKWRREDQSAWGELSGAVTGNVVHFTWKEHQYGMVGPAAESAGKGVFVYKKAEGAFAELDGQYGLKDDEVGSDWHNVKQAGKKPDLNSISGNMGGVAPTPGQKWE